jgi:hypothetical protein
VLGWSPMTRSNGTSPSREHHSGGSVPPLRAQPISAHLPDNLDDIRRVQEWMGHADVQTTMRYLHYAPRHDDAALVARAFGSEPGAEAGGRCSVSLTASARRPASAFDRGCSTRERRLSGCIGKEPRRTGSGGVLCQAKQQSATTARVPRDDRLGRSAVTFGSRARPPRMARSWLADPLAPRCAPCGPPRVPSAPGLVRHVRDESELVHLDLLAHRVARLDRSEATLRGERELLAREEARRLLDAIPELGS